MQYLSKSYQPYMTTFVNNWNSYFSLTWFHHAWIVKFTLTLSSGMSGDIDFNIIIMHGLWYWFLYYHHAWLVILILILSSCMAGDINFDFIIMHGWWYLFLYHHHVWLVIFILTLSSCMAGDIHFNRANMLVVKKFRCLQHSRRGRWREGSALKKENRKI